MDGWMDISMIMLFDEKLDSFFWKYHVDIFHLPLSIRALLLSFCLFICV